MWCPDPRAADGRCAFGVGAAGPDPIPAGGQGDPQTDVPGSQHRRLNELLRGIAVAAVVALGGLYLGSRVKLPQGGFVPGSFVTHTFMLVASLVIIRFWRGKRLADFGFTWGRDRLRPSILLWGLPTAVLSLMSALAPRLGEAEGALAHRSLLQLVLFVWVYASVCEEVLTRGLLQSLIGGWGVAIGSSARFSVTVVVSGLFFGAMHLVLIDSMGLFALVPIVLATLLGFLAAHYRETTGSLIPAIIVHALFNVGGMLPGWILRWLGVQ